MDHGDVSKRPPLKFAWVMEYTKVGTPHLHCTVDQYIARDWLVAKWEKLTGAWNVDIRAKDPDEVALYLSKYMSKSMGVLVGDVAAPLSRRVPKM